jgi:LysM repeat protein
VKVKGEIKMTRNTLSGIRAALLVLMLIAVLALPSAVQAQGQVHIVQRGETLSSIAARYGTTVQALMQINGLSNPNFIWVGQRLVVSGSGGSSSAGSSGSGGVHIVQRGETLSSIALRYGTSISALVQANGLSSANFIWVGQRLRISTGTSSGGSTRTGGGYVPGTGAVHVVQRGETLSSIALRYGTTAWAIASANGLSNMNFVWVGQRLTIPGSSSGGSSSGGNSGGGSVPPSGGGSGRWIDVDLSSQSVRAYEGNAVVKSMIVSTGTARYPTPVGRFKIYAKYPSVTMSGPGYYLTGVPHTMYFYGGYALHGTYWHNNFGHPMSHGCINLTKADAAWLYSWASVGTAVVIHQ